MSGVPRPDSFVMQPKADFAAFEAAKYFPALDGMRAFCVFLVMFNHLHVATPHWILGSLGVDVFFVLSGFLITTLLLRERERTGAVSLRGFYTRRFFRIVPVYAFTILLYFTAVHATHDAVKTEQFKTALPWLISFLPEYRPVGSGNVLGHAWTLGVEEKFYVLWPLLLIALFPFRSRGLWFVGIIFAMILPLTHVFARSYGGLLIGAVLAIALSSSGRWRIAAYLGRVPEVVFVLLVVAAYWLNIFGNQSVLIFSFMMALLIGSLVLREGPLRKILEAPVLIFIGKRSYAMYLIHLLVLDSIERLTPKYLPAHWLLIVGLAYLCSLACASLLYVCVERPGISFGRRLSKRWAIRANGVTMPARV